MEIDNDTIFTILGIGINIKDNEKALICRGNSWYKI